MIKTLIHRLKDQLTQSGNPVWVYLNYDEKFIPDDLTHSLKLYGLEQLEDLYMMYEQIPGMDSNLIYLPKIGYKVCYFGSPIFYKDAIKLHGTLCMREENIYKYRFLPIFLSLVLGLSAPILIDLAPKSKTFGMVYYDSPATGITPPITIYDSLEKLFETIVTCYDQNVYTVTEQFILNCDEEKEIEIAATLNPKAAFWRKRV